MKILVMLLLWAAQWGDKEMCVRQFNPDNSIVCYKSKVDIRFVKDRIVITTNRYKLDMYILYSRTITARNYENVVYIVARGSIKYSIRIIRDHEDNAVIVLPHRMHTLEPSPVGIAMTASNCK